MREKWLIKGHKGEVRQLRAIWNNAKLMGALNRNNMSNLEKFATNGSEHCNLERHSAVESDSELFRALHSHLELSRNLKAICSKPQRLGAIPTNHV